MAGGHIAQLRLRCAQSGKAQAAFVDGHRAAGNSLHLQNCAGAAIARVFHGCGFARKQMRQLPQQIFGTGAHHDLIGCAGHPAILPQMPGNGSAQAFIAQGVSVAQKLGLVVQQLFLNAPPLPEGKQRGVHAARGKIKRKVRRRFGCAGLWQGLLCGRGHGCIVFQHHKPAARAAFHQPLSRQDLIGGVNGIHAYAQLPGHGALARKAAARRALTGAYFVRKKTIQLFIQRQRTVCIKSDHSKLTP